MTLLIAANISSAVVAEEQTSGVLTVGTYRLLLQVIVFVGLPIAAFGMAGNIINIIVYIKMGFTESTNISLAALAFSDLGVVATAICTEIVFLLPIVQDVSIAPEVSFTLVAFPHLILTRTSAMITAFISLERYLCVFLPLEIRRIITPKRTFIIMVVIFVAVISPMITVYFRYPLGWRFFPEQNRSLLGILPMNDTTVETSFLIFQAYSSIVLPISSFVLVTFCTILLSVNLRRSKAWRDSNRGNKKQTSPASESEPSTEASKENKAIKMVVAIATVFIISSIPSCIHIIVVMMVPEFDITGRYANIFIVTGNAFFVGDTINCSANIIIYYNMSSKFRQAAQELFSVKRHSAARQIT
ncbi:chemosensory receptor B [Elysia marginata]|uniref:Chemosensory receptor B n=1 Tax=Elysia marginata TaxID=1093978 RepID=A0AAV4FCZ0_9GAST|nr:chemosensory receptor B [Elysia marginata]